MHHWSFKDNFLQFLSSSIRQYVDSGAIQFEMLLFYKRFEFTVKYNEHDACKTYSGGKKLFITNELRSLEKRFIFLYFRLPFQDIWLKRWNSIFLYQIQTSDICIQKWMFSIKIWLLGKIPRKWNYIKHLFNSFIIRENIQSFW